MTKQKRGLRLCTTVVTTEGRADKKSNAERMAAAHELLHVMRKKVDLIALPAGFLRAANESEFGAVTGDLIYAARDAAVAVVFGVDTAATADREKVKQGRLPYYLFLWGPGIGTSYWRQQTLTSTDRVPSDEVMGYGVSTGPYRPRPRRCVEIAGRTVAAIACGEVFNASIREAVARAKPEVAVLAAHTASGARHWAAQRALARLGVPSVRAVHASGEARDVLCAARKEVKPLEVIEIGGIVASRYEL